MYLLEMALRGKAAGFEEVMKQISPKEAEEGGESFEDFMKSMGLDQGLGAAEQDLLKKLTEDPEELTKAMNELIFKKDGDDEQPPVEFLEVLTLVNKRVAARSVERAYSLHSIGKKQMPCFVSMLTKKLYLLPRIPLKQKK